MTKGFNAVSIAIAMSISTLASAQVNVAPAMPQPVMPNQAPAMPQPVTPGQVANQVVAPVSVGGSSASDMFQRNTLREISAKKAELELLKIDAELKKYKQPDQEAAKKDEVNSVAAALEQAKKEQAQLAPVEQVIPVTLLATFRMPEVPGASYAELKVGDLIVNAKVGERLPSGHYVKAIKFDSIEISKSKNANKGEVLFISASDAASVYSSRGKSGVVEAPQAHAAVPAGLPPLPTK